MDHPLVHPRGPRLPHQKLLLHDLQLLPRPLRRPLPPRQDPPIQNPRQQAPPPTPHRRRRRHPPAPRRPPPRPQNGAWPHRRLRRRGLLLHRRPARPRKGPRRPRRSIRHRRRHRRRLRVEPQRRRRGALLAVDGEARAHRGVVGGRGEEPGGGAAAGGGRGHEGGGRGVRDGVFGARRSAAEEAGDRAYWGRRGDVDSRREADAGEEPRAAGRVSDARAEAFHGVPVSARLARLCGFVCRGVSCGDDVASRRRRRRGVGWSV
mmetsp:Transcript_23525/g.58441  ORF Transcript_23525/g.58441 Transcript_23525/m.58441 type:complete len:263 (-) Transcript_23525:415-1203(-)